MMIKIIQRRDCDITRAVVSDIEITLTLAEEEGRKQKKSPSMIDSVT
jgi:hypothetical protein